MSTEITVLSEPSIGYITLVELETYIIGKENKIEKVYLAYGESISLHTISNRTISIKEVVL